MSCLSRVFVVCLLTAFGGVCQAQLVNLALNKPVTASTQLNSNFIPERAVDGDTSSSTFYHSATNDFAPFWEVDLGAEYPIEDILLYNRADGSGNFGNRLNNVFVQVKDSSDTEVWLSTIFNPWDGEGLAADINNPGAGPHSFDPSGAVGQFVRVFKDPAHDGSEWLPLAEVEVMVSAASLTSLVVDRNTGSLTLSHSAGAPSNLQFLGYSITSDLGALDNSGWKSIADNYDADSGDMSADGDDTWFELAGNLNELAEFQFEGTANDGVTLTPGNSIVLSEGTTGAGAGWLSTNNEVDLQMELILPGGERFDVPVVYSGNGGSPLSRSDFDASGVIDALDYLTLRSSFPTDLASGDSAALRHRMGDTDFDGDVDINDVMNFRSDYESAFGAGSFSALVASTQVPEPNSAWIAVGLIGLVGLYRIRRAVPMAALLVVASIASNANADTLGWWRMGDDDSFPFLDDFVFQSDINTGTFGNLTLPVTSVEPQYSNLVPGATIVDGMTGSKNLNEWSIYSLQNGEFPQSLSTADQTIPGAFTYETFVRFADTSVSNGDDFGRHWSGDNGFLMQLAPNTSGSALFETFNVTVRADNAGAAANVNLNSTTKAVDGEWYHVALVFEGNSTDGSDDVHLFVNGKLEASGNVDDAATFGGDTAPVLVGEVVSDSSLHVDEVRYMDQALALDGSDFLRVGTLRASIDPNTGSVQLINDSLQSVDLASYQIDSPAGRLLTDDVNWESLSDSNIDSIGAGDGESWDEGEASDANSIGEVFWLGSSMIAPGGMIDLGTPYSTGSIDQDLEFRYYDLALGKTVSAYVEFAELLGLPGDFNGDGSVNLADYTVWRNNLGGPESALNGNGDNSGGSAGVVDAADYALWKSTFGNSSGSLAGVATAAVPEPATWWMAVLGVAACLGWRGRSFSLRFAAIKAGTLAIVATMVASSALAVVTTERFYSMGDHPNEDGADQGLVGSAFGVGIDVLDSSGSNVDLTQSGGVVYHQITASDVSEGHPGPVGTFAVAFNGTSDFLFSDTILDSMGSGSSQGMQMWVRPETANLGSTRQAIGYDSNNAGGPTVTAEGNWGQINSGIGNSIPATEAVVANQWYHVAQHIYLHSDSSAPDLVEGAARTFTSVIFVNGLAVSANNDNSGTPAGDFMLGASGDDSAAADFFSGVIDEVEIYSSAADAFDLYTDNDYVAQAISELPGGTLQAGDANLDGLVNTDDIDVLVQNWRMEKQIEGAHNTMYVGDWQTRGWGDLNLDGRVDLLDAYELHISLQANGSVGLNLAYFANLQAVPEPSTMWLGGGLLACLAVVRSVRRQR